MDEYAKKIPMDPTGFTKRCEFHISYEAEKKRCGKAVYRIVDPNGEETPIYHRYDTHPTQGYSAYRVDGCDTDFKKWADVAAKWNELLAAKEVANG